MSYTHELAEFAESLTFDRLPPEVADQAKRIILDTVGCGLGGSITEPVKVIDKALSAEKGPGESTLMGRGGKTSSAQAAFRNAAASNILDYCDTFLRLGHYASTIVPTALAVAEGCRASGKDVIAAVAAAYEVTARIGVAIHPSPDRFVEVWGIGTHQVFGAAVAAAHLMGLKGDEFKQALGLAGVSAPLPSALIWNWDDRPLSWHKDSVHWPAWSGVMAARLAGAGFSGPRSVLDGRHGFWVMSGSDQFNPGELTRGLGEEWRILETSFKPYPACRWIHPILDALGSLAEAHDIESADVDKIEIETFHLFEHYGFLDPAPVNMIDAEFSVPYGAAMVLQRRPPGPGWYEPDLFTDEEVLRLASSVELYSNDEMNRLYYENNMPARVIVHVKGGATFKEEVLIARGDPRNPLSDMELTAKFNGLARGVLGDGAAEELKAAINRLEQLPSMEPVVKGFGGVADASDP